MALASAVFQSNLRRRRTGAACAPGLIAATVALAAATYKYIERPFRFGHSPRFRASSAVAAVASLGIVSAVGFWRGGVFWPDRSFVSVAHEGDVGAEAYVRYRDAHFAPCSEALFPPARERRADVEACRQSVGGAAPELIVLGDSHADHLFVGLAEALPGRNVAVYATVELPLMDAPLFASVYRAIAKEPRVRTVVISAYWGARIRYLPKSVDFRGQMRRTVEFLSRAGKAVYVLNDIPAFGLRPSRCKYTARLGLPQICAESLARLSPVLASYEAALRDSVEGVAGAHFVDTWRKLCDARSCSMASGRELLYRDWSHFNLNGSRWMGLRLVEATRGLPP